jgi:ketosteroid isomerase-like protein
MTAREFERFVRAWEDAFERGEYQAMAASYSDDAVLRGTGLPTVSGRAAIAEFWRTASEGARQAGVERRVHAEHYDSCGDLAYLQGTVTLEAGSGATVAWFVTVWKRYGDSDWKIVSDTSTIVVRVQEAAEAVGGAHG